MSAYGNLAPGVRDSEIEVRPLRCECCERIISDDQDVDIFGAVVLCEDCEREQDL